VRHIGQEFGFVSVRLLELAVDLEDLFIRPAQGRVLAHQVSVRILQAGDQALPFRAQSLLLKVALEQLAEPLEIDRLGDVIIRTAAQGFCRDLLGSVGRHHHDHGLRKVAQHLGKQREPALLRHLDVEEDQGRPPAVQLAAALGGVRRRDHLKTLPRDGLGQKGAVVGVIVDGQ